MKIRFLTLTILFFFISCQTDKTTTIEGDLYFKLIKFPSFHEASDSLIQKIETDIKNVNENKMDKQNKITNDYLKFLSKEKLLKNPYVSLRKDNGEIVTVYLDKINYDQLKKYDYNKLISENKKVRIKAEVTELKFDTLKIYKVDGKISVEKLDGKTYWKK